MLSRGLGVGVAEGEGLGFGELPGDVDVVGDGSVCWLPPSAGVASEVGEGFRRPVPTVKPSSSSAHPRASMPKSTLRTKNFAPRCRFIQRTKPFRHVASVFAFWSGMRARSHRPFMNAYTRQAAPQTLIPRGFDRIAKNRPCRSPAHEQPRRRWSCA